MLYGHRRDYIGYKNALEELDKYIPEMIDNLNDDTREYIPILAFGKKLNKNINIGVKESFVSIAATIEKYLLGQTKLEGAFI